MRNTHRAGITGAALLLTLGAGGVAYAGGTTPETPPRTSSPCNGVVGDDLTVGVPVCAPVTVDPVVTVNAPDLLDVDALLGDLLG